jgi:hypothetical protein
MESYSIEDMVAYAIGKLQGGWTTEQVEASIRETLAKEQWPTQAIEATVRQVGIQVQEKNKASMPKQADTLPILEMMQRMMDRMDKIERRSTPPTPTLRPIPTPQTIAITKKRYPDPELFDGTRSKYQGWKYNCQAKLRGDGFLYPLDEEKNQYIFLRTKDKATSTLLPWLRINEKKPVQDLWAFMDIEFGDQFEEESAIDKLQSIKQNKDSLRVYRQRFNELFLRSGEPVSDRLKRTWFLRGLNQATYSQMSSINPQLGFTEFTDEAIRLADFYYRGKFLNQTISSSTQETRQPTARRPAWPERMDWQPTSTTANQSNAERKRAKWVSGKEIQRRREKGLCVRCGAEGHYVQCCPYLAARRPSPVRAAKALPAPIAPLLEDEPIVEFDSESEKE